MTHPQHEILEFTRHALCVGDLVPVSISPLTGGGSNRTFYRILYGDNHSVIFMHFDHSSEENNYYAPIAAFLQEIGVPVPRIVKHHHGKGFIVMEDLGDVDMWFYRHEPWQIRQKRYRKILAAIHRLHVFPPEDFPSGNVSLMEGFCSALYQWERQYFYENFIQAICGINLSPSEERELENELSGLSERLGNTKHCLIHRDLQSRNVMIRGDEPVFIDFQGMRFGNLFYDLGSLLYDPYVSLNAHERMELLQYYYQLPVRDGVADWPGYQETFWEASAQRLMQALGAYGFLGLKRGLHEFLTHIPSGLTNLIDAATRAKRLPLLKSLALRCRDSRILY